MRSTLLRTALVAGTAFNLVAMAAQAQTASAASEVSEVTVTGSRVITNGNNAPTPLSVLTTDQALVTKPTTLYENLAEMPVFSGSRGSSNGPVGNSASGAGAVSSLNLRNMGALRTLTLFDGHRVPPTTPDALVDVSALPQMLIQRIDVVTGGASAVYGSDAVTGVVNYITDSKFNGLKVDMQTGMSQLSDAKTYQFGIAGGAKLFDGRGHIEGSYQRIHDDGLYDTQRDWTKPRWTVQGNGTTIPWHLVGNLTNATASYGGAIACPANGLVDPAACPGVLLVGQSFNANGVLSPFDPGLRGAANGLASTAVQIGGDGVYFNNVAVKSASVRDQVFGRFDYDLTDNIHAYVAGSANKTNVTGNVGVQRSFPPGWKIGACNPYLAAQYRTQLGCTAANSGTATEPTFSLEKAFDPYINYGAGQNNDLTIKSYFFTADLSGKFGDNWRWDATYTRSDSKLRVNALNQNRQHVYAALDAVADSTGKLVCRTDITNPGLNPGCVPLNPFGPTAPTKEMVYYLFDQIYNSSDNKLNGVSGSLSGSLFSTWAGPIDVALSGEVRKLEMSLDTNSKVSDFLNCTGLRFGNCNPTVPIHANGWLPIKGVTQDVKEAAVEVNVPLLKDVALAKELNLNGAARRTTYNNDSGGSSTINPSFSATTWKVGLVWQVVDELTVRTARSRDIRAPSLYDLFQPFTVGNIGFATDYLINSGGAQVPAAPKSGGNPGLTPEVADTSTLGVVFRPTPNLSIAIDGYSIKLTNVLYSLNGAAEPNQRACYASGGTSALCQLQDRPLGNYTNTSNANAVTAFYTRQINIAEQTTKGIDTEVNYKTELFDHPLSVRGLLTYQPHIYYHFPDFPVVLDYAGVAYPQTGGLPAPVWKGSIFVSYTPVENWTVDISERYRSSLHWSANPTQTSIGGVKAVAYTNLTLTHGMKVGSGQANLFLSVQNLFDKDPPPAGTLAQTFPGSFPGTFAVGDEVVGRYCTLGLKLRY